MSVTADRLIVIGQGRLLAETTVADLSRRSATLEDAFLELTAAATDFRGSR
jgi:ABC-2 type transport system ATP-binding protein